MYIYIYIVFIRTKNNMMSTTLTLVHSHESDMSLRRLLVGSYTTLFYLPLCCFLGLFVYFHIHLEFMDAASQSTAEDLALAHGQTPHEESGTALIYATTNSANMMNAKESHKGAGSRETIDRRRVSAGLALGPAGLSPSTQAGLRQVVTLLGPRDHSNRHSALRQAVTSPGLGRHSNGQNALRQRVTSPGLGSHSDGQNALRQVVTSLRPGSQSNRQNALRQAVTSPGPGNHSNRQLSSRKQPVKSRNSTWLQTDDAATFREWSRNITRGCNGEFIVFSNQFVYLKNVLVDRTKAEAKAVGGEDVLSVQNRPDQDEVYSYHAGFYRLQCAFLPHITLINGAMHLTQWLQALQVTNHSALIMAPTYRLKRFVLAVTRYEYANLYWTIMDIYNLFLTLRFLGRMPNSTHVLLVDAKPRGHLDDLWQTFFASTTRLSQLPTYSHIDELVWAPARKHSPMLRYTTKSLPLQGSFRRQMLKAFGIPDVGPRYANCDANNFTFNVLFVWRRDYVAHPRNPSGRVSRKIANEDELLELTKLTFPRWRVRGVQLDAITIQQQLQIVADTDILIGMHGAALAFSIFLAPGAGLIEMFPATGKSNWHMEMLAHWSHVHYISWKNHQRRNEYVRSRSTRVPPETVVSLLKVIHTMICPSRSANQR